MDRWVVDSEIESWNGVKECKKKWYGQKWVNEEEAFITRVEIEIERNRNSEKWDRESSEKLLCR